MFQQVKIAPSILSADFMNLQRDIEMIERAGAGYVHVDVMDGHFVPNLTIGVPHVKQLKGITRLPLDVHLMVVKPERFVGRVAALGAKVMNVHVEACDHLHRVVQQIKEAGMMAAVTLNPHTPINSVEEIVQDLDIVMLMGVNPGFGGQNFIENTVEKTRRMSELISRKNAKTLIEIDGGVNNVTGAQLAEAGADILVAGSFVFGAEDPIKTIEGLKKL